MIRIDHVSKKFPAGSSHLLALDNIDIELSGSGIIALMGPSGSGKSTLLNVIGALDTPTNGRVFVDTAEVSSMTAEQRAAFRNRACGFIFQNFNLIPVLTVLENVMLPSQLGRQAISSAVREYAVELVNAVGLHAQMDQKINRLSGGQMQRVAIARALINRPKVILADEPTANLDLQTAATVLDLLRKICNSRKTLVVMATHDRSTLDYCMRVITMQDGRIISDSTQAAKN